METLADYEQRKARECELLSHAVTTPSPDPALCGVALHKVHLTRAIRRSAVDTDSFASETNWSGRTSFRIADIGFRYNYQRFDLTISGPPVYVGTSASDVFASPSTYFLCSGMAAAAAVLASTDRLLVTTAELWTLSDAYFETRHVAEHYTSKLMVRVGASFAAIAAEACTSSTAIVAHLDSITAADWLPELSLLGTMKVVLAVFDTTCYARTAPRIVDVVQTLSRLGIPTVLIRSHLKLDSLGSEYGRLGSVVLCEAAGGTKVIDGLRHLLPDAIRSFGSAASPASFFPVEQSEEFLILTARRTAAIADNAAVLADTLSRELAGQRVQVRRYHHGMFVSLHDSNWVTSAAISSLIDRALSSYRDLGRNGVHATSFGFDFPVLTEVCDVSTGSFMLRIAPSDEPASYMSELAGLIAKAWRDACEDRQAMRTSYPH